MASMSESAHRENVLSAMQAQARTTRGIEQEVSFLRKMIEQLAAQRPTDCICPGDATSHCLNPLCPRKPVLPR